jgi:hypothetical protein
MTYLDYREQTIEYHGDRTTLFNGVQSHLQTDGSEKPLTLYYTKQNFDLVQYFQRIVKLLKINLRYELLEGNRGEQEDIHAMKYFTRKIKNDEKIILFEDFSGSLASDSSSQYQYLVERGVNPKNVAVFSRNCLALDQKAFQCQGEFGFIMKKFFFYNFPQDWMVVFANRDRMSLKEWMIY